MVFLLVDAMVEERKHVLKRLKRLLDTAGTSYLSQDTRY